MALLDIKDLYIRYDTRDSKTRAVNGISLSIGKGETLGLVGETGAGKTTAALSIMRLIPQPPGIYAGGSIEYEGKNILELSDSEIRRIRGNEISMIFQDPMTALNPIMRVGDQIAEVIRLHNKCSEAKAYKQALEMLEMVGIPPERSMEYPHQFSGGMKQRVIIAIALACTPRLLLADEPTTALDVTIQAQILEMINDLKRKFDTSVLLITHDLGIVVECCDNVAIMYAGEIVEYGSVEQIFRKPAHPYTVGLFGSIPSLEEDVERLKPIAGLMPDPAALPEGCYFSTRCPFAADGCHREHPGSTDIGGGHQVRCFRAQEGGQL